MHAAALGDWVREFVRVSNRMAGILRDPTAAEVAAHRGLLAVNTLRVENFEVFLQHIAPGAGFRDSLDDGDPEPEGDSTSDARSDLATIVQAARTRSATPERLHRLYRQLRPFTDGNGRAGRVLWMWQLMRATREERAALAKLNLWDARHPLKADVAPRSTLM